MASTFSSEAYHARAPKRKPYRKDSGTGGLQQLLPDEFRNDSGTGRVDRRGSRYGQAALHSELAALETSGRGSRHVRLFASSARLGELVAGGELDEAWAFAQLRDAGDRLKPGAGSDVIRCVNAGLARGARQPRRAPRDGQMVRNAADARARTSALVADALGRPELWSGVEGATALKVLVGLAGISLRVGKVRVSASYREIAEAAGVGLGAVGAAIGRLEGRWCRVVRPGHQRRSKEPTCFQLLVDVDRSAVPPTNGAGGTHDGEEYECSFVAPSLPARAPGRLLEGLRDPGCALWRRRGNAWRIFNALEAAWVDRETLSAAELSSGLGIPLRTVWRNLSWLADAGVARSAGDGHWELATSETPEELTERLELVPRGAVAHRYRLEHQLHRLRLRISSLRGWLNQAEPHQRDAIAERIDTAIGLHRGVAAELAAHREVLGELRARERSAALARRGVHRRR